MKNIIEFGDCRAIMKKWAQLGVKVNTCVTSPPYYGLRDYGHSEQIGLELSPNEYVKNLVEVFRHVREILHDDGTIWVNLGDSYAGSNKGQWHGESKDPYNNKTQGMSLERVPAGKIGLKQKDLIGIPWRVAFALQEDGWYLRQDIIWNKPSPMPESVRDRCTKAHEYIFLLSKNKNYYFDQEAIKEKSNTFDNNVRDRENTRLNNTPGRTKMGGLTKNNYEYKNKRSVWTVAAKAYSGAHFAVYPPELIAPCILAGSPKGGIVLDPFMGSGTTAYTAKENSRHYLGCEINKEYKPLQDERLIQEVLYI
jgi:DNA modification methylase